MLSSAAAWAVLRGIPIGVKRKCRVARAPRRGSGREDRGIGGEGRIVGHRKQIVGKAGRRNTSRVERGRGERGRGARVDGPLLLLLLGLEQ
jgi:hypothetical protein